MSDFVTAEVISYPIGAMVRLGSPFRGEPTYTPPANTQTAVQGFSGEAFYDIGPTRYMAWGAVIASIIMLGFSAAAIYWFPAGGILIACLGTGLGAFGLASPKPKTSALLTVIHLAGLVGAYYRITNG